MSILEEYGGYEEVSSLVVDTHAAEHDAFLFDLRPFLH
jgi:hypothetical protein